MEVDMCACDDEERGRLWPIWLFRDPGFSFRWFYHLLGPQDSLHSSGQREIGSWFFFFPTCPGHEPGMGTEQKPMWDKQGVVLSPDMRQPTRCHSTQARDKGADLNRKILRTRKGRNVHHLCTLTNGQISVMAMRNNLAVCPGKGSHDFEECLASLYLKCLFDYNEELTEFWNMITVNDNVIWV